MKSVRCAIYTRKSSDEGLEQAFNSLDAQREACAAYVLSQASEGWVALPDIYDDGGLSGGTLQRPALQRLLAEVAAGRVDIIVVYKVDRLTRSLFDFAKLVETLDAGGTSFVSVTQSFNTTTSMGRLTLNMLLSFAQFEREVTAERIRDKIAASKAKGMWMGGTPPLGYQPDGRSLAIVEDHAAIIRSLFERYLVLGNVRLLAEELVRKKIRLPTRTRVSGVGYGGGWFSRGQIYKILSNQIYIGRIAHGDKSHAGQHPAIIDLDLWERVQAKLAASIGGTRTGTRVSSSPSLLAGKVRDAAGQPLMAVHASRSGRRYRYYVSKSTNDGPGGNSIHIPALELETAVTGHLAQALDDPFALAGIASLTVTSGTTLSLLERAADTAALLRKRHKATTQAWVSHARIHDGWIDIVCDTSVVAEALGLSLAPDSPSSFTVAAPVTLTRSGRAIRLVQDDGSRVRPAANTAIINLMIKARRWWKILRDGELHIKQLAAAEGVQAAYITRVVRLAFLSPAVADAALKGGLRSSVDAFQLTLGEGIPACWKAQAAAMLPKER